MPTLLERSNGMYYISYEDDGKREWKSRVMSRFTSSEVGFMPKIQKILSSANHPISSVNV